MADVKILIALRAKPLPKKRPRSGRRLTKGGKRGSRLPRRGSTEIDKTAAGKGLDGERKDLSELPD